MSRICAWSIWFTPKLLFDCVGNMKIDIFRKQGFSSVGLSKGLSGTNSNNWNKVSLGIFQETRNCKQIQHSKARFRGFISSITLGDWMSKYEQVWATETKHRNWYAILKITHLEYTCTVAKSRELMLCTPTLLQNEEISLFLLNEHCCILNRTHVVYMVA